MRCREDTRCRSAIGSALLTSSCIFVSLQKRRSDYVVFFICKIYLWASGNVGYDSKIITEVHSLYVFFNVLKNEKIYFIVAYLSILTKCASEMSLNISDISDLFHLETTPL